MEGRGAGVRGAPGAGGALTPRPPAGDSAAALGALLPGAAQLAWLAASQGDYLRYQAALVQVREVQEQLLLDYLAENHDTAYGRAHGFASIRTVDEYRERVPLAPWDALEPWVERVAAGEEGVLTREPVTLLEPSSGSTRAVKRVPYTARLQREFSRAVAAWVCDLHATRPELLGGPAYWSVTPLATRDEEPDSAVPMGFEEDSAYLGGAMQAVVDRTLAVPGAVRHLRDPARFRHVTLLFLLAARELRLVSVWHPSFLELLLDHLVERWEELLGDLERGLESDVEGLAVPARPARARELRDASPEALRELWPRLALVSGWADGPAARAADRLAARLGEGIEYQPKGLLATEAFVSLPFRGTHPLAVSSHFFELLDGEGRSHLAHEVEEGGRYTLGVTTGGGLYRYHLEDLVEVAGFLDQAPCLRFLGKADRVVDLRGEKLSEGFVARVVDRLLEPLDATPAFALLSPEEREPPGYVLHLELPAPLPEDLAARLDEALGENPHYHLARRLGQLGPARVATTRPAASSRYLARLEDEGQRLGDVKPATLDTRAGWARWLEPAG